MDYKLRITVKDGENEHEFRERVVKWVTKYGTAFGVCERDASHPHYHIWLRTESKIKSVRENFKYTFPTHKGNGSYSLEVCETPNLQYLVKGDEKGRMPDVILNTMGITELEIAEAHTARWEVTDQLSKKKKERVTSGVARKPDNEVEEVTVLRKIERYVKEKYSEAEWSRFTCFQCAQQVMDWYLEKCDKFPQSHYGKSLTQGLWLLLTTTGTYQGKQMTMREKQVRIYKNWFNGDPETQNQEL